MEGFRYMICEDCKYKDICKYVDIAAVAKIDKATEGLPLDIVCTKKVATAKMTEVMEVKQVEIQRV